MRPAILHDCLRTREDAFFSMWILVRAERLLKCPSDRFIPISMINTLRAVTRDPRISSRGGKLYPATALRVSPRLFYLSYLFYGRVCYKCISTERALYISGLSRACPVRRII